MFFVYLLTSRGSDRGYVGFTTDPLRRLRQHNREIKGGAKKTFKHHPWDLSAIVHGFSTSEAALKFEWAWQHPHLTSRFSAETRRVFSRSVKLSMLIAVGKQLVIDFKEERGRLRICLLTEDARQAYSFSSIAGRIREPNWPVADDNITSVTKFEEWFRARTRAAKLDEGVDEDGDGDGGGGGRGLIEMGEGEDEEEEASWQSVASTVSVDSAEARAKSSGLWAPETCELCLQPLRRGPDEDMVLRCPAADKQRCNGEYHITCIAVLELRDKPKDAFIPTSITCPFCGESASWTQAVINSLTTPSKT
jgi:predicted GIY-YIG superfamily endonuclease